MDSCIASLDATVSNARRKNHRLHSPLHPERIKKPDRTHPAGDQGGEVQLFAIVACVAPVGVALGIDAHRP